MQAYICEEGLARFCTVSLKFVDRSAYLDQIRKADEGEFQKSFHAPHKLRNQQVQR